MGFAGRGPRGDTPRWAANIAGCGTLVALLTFSATAHGELAVAWEKGRLDVAAQEVPLSEILREVSIRSGLRIQGLEDLDDDVKIPSVRFSGLPLREGLRRLLANQNYALYEQHSQENPGQRARAILILGSATGANSRSRSPVRTAKPGMEAMTGTVTMEELNALAQQGDRQALIQAAASQDPQVQASALDLLTEMDPQSAVALLVQASKSPNKQTRIRAIELLRSNERADEALVLRTLGEATTDPDSAVKRFAITALAERASPEALGYLRQSLHDSDPAVRMATVEDIVRAVPPEKAHPLLEEATLDEDNDVRSSAAAWLEQLSQRSP